MSINIYRLTKKGNIPISSQSKTLDQITRELPQGFYTTFSTLSNATRVLGLHMHLQRLYVPAVEQSIRPSVEEPLLRKQIADLVKINLPHESRVRLILSKKDGAIYVLTQPFEPLAKHIYEKGVRVITADLARNSPNIKDTGFISSSVDQRKLVGGDVFEVLLAKNGKILEGMTSNFYGIRGNTLITAQRGILPGVTRRVVLRLARGDGMSVEYRAPTVGEKLDEAFLTSSSRGVVPIVSIDGKPVGQGRPGDWTKTLSKAYQAYLKESSEAILQE